MTTWVPTTLDSFDTAESIWQKLLQLGWPETVLAGPGPRIQEGIATFQSSDGTWHLVDLATEGGINVERVDAANQADPGSPYIGYAVLRATDGTRHKVMLELEGGMHVLRVTQASTVEAPSVDVSLAAPGGLYDVTLDVEGGIYVLRIEQ